MSSSVTELPKMLLADEVFTGAIGFITQTQYTLRVGHHTAWKESVIVILLHLLRRALLLG